MRPTNSRFPLIKIATENRSRLKTVLAAKAVLFSVAFMGVAPACDARDLAYRMSHDGIPYVGTQPPRNRIGCAYDPVKQKGVCKSPGSGMIYLEDPDTVPRTFIPAGCYLIDPANEGLGWKCSTRQPRH